MATYNIEKGATTISQLRKFAVENPEKPAFIFVDKNLKRRVLTRKDIWDKSRKFAAVLRRSGIVKGDIVCNTLANSPERLITNFGTILAGAVSMHGQIFLADGEDIIKNWKDSECKAVLMDPTQKGGIASILERIQHKDKETGDVRYTGLDNLSLVIPIILAKYDDTGSLSQTLEAETDVYVNDSVTEEDDAYVFTTSGSTGFAKLVPHTHRSCLQIGRQFAGVFEAFEDSIHLSSRSFGWMVGFPHLYTVLGYTRVIIDNSAGEPEDLEALIVTVINQEGCDCGSILSSNIRQIVKATDSGRLEIPRRLRILLLSGMPVYRTQMKAIGLITDAVAIVYGSTEIGAVFGLKVTDADSYEDTCVGYPTESVEFKVVGDNKEELPTGCTGEIYLYSPTTAKGYIKNPESTKQAFLEDGWYRTSDEGYVNNKGQLFVFCRKSNVINHMGYLHYPGWMEARINNHPDIQQSIVLGIPNTTTYEDFCLCLIKSDEAKLTDDDVQEFCKSLFLTSVKDTITPLPKYILWFDSFPTNTNGKFVRKALKEEAFRRIGGRLCGIRSRTRVRSLAHEELLRFGMGRVNFNNSLLEMNQSSKVLSSK